jgi:hypothetical protein
MEEEVKIDKLKLLEQFIIPLATQIQKLEKQTYKDTRHI